MYDIHCHILPEVDDGAGSLEEAIEMAIMAKENGIKAIFATPHFIEGAGFSDSTYNREVLYKLNSELKHRGIEISIYAGCEVYSTPEVLKLLEKGQIATLNNSNYMLVELPMHDVPIYIESMIYSLKLKRITPIIAHPERNAEIIRDPNILHNFILKGALAQLNLPSLLGLYGERVKDTAEILLKHDMIHFVATDAHRPSRRFYNIRDALNILKGIVDEDKFIEITTLNPESVISGTNIEAQEPKLYNPKKGIMKILGKILSK